MQSTTKTTCLLTIVYDDERFGGGVFTDFDTDNVLVKLHNENCSKRQE